MYGMPGNRFGSMIEVSGNDVPELIKEAQVAGKATRAFVVGSKQLALSYDGMFLVNANSGEIVEDTTFATGRIFTPVLS